MWNTATGFLWNLEDNACFMKETISSTCNMTTVIHTTNRSDKCVPFRPNTEAIVIMQEENFLPNS